MESPENVEPLDTTLTITKPFLEELLEQKVSDYKVTLGSAPGDNYMSVIHAVEVNLVEKDTPLHILVKCYPSHPARVDFLNACNLFGKELLVYETWIPTLMRMQEEIGNEEKIQLSIPKYLGGNLTSNKSSRFSAPFRKYNFIVMEDMRKTDGVKMANRCSGLDFQHARLVMEELATFHAISWIYKQKYNVAKITDIHPELGESMFSQEELKEQMKPLLDSMIQNAVGMLKEEAPYYEGAKKVFSYDNEEAYFMFLQPDGIDWHKAETYVRVKAAVPDNDDPWLLGCHGDCWVNNLMFKYDEKKIPTKVAILDMQIYREACPTTDLLYFFFSSLTYDTRKKYEFTLLRIYYKRFLRVCNTLKGTQMPGFTFERLRRRFRTAKVFGLFVALPVLSIILNAPETAVDLDKMDVNENADMSDMFSTVVKDSDKNAVFKERVEGILQELFDEGVI